MRTRTMLAIGLAVLLGCSGGQVTLDVDVLSFLNRGDDTEDPFADYATLRLPTDVVVQGIDLVTPTEITLVDAIDDLTVVDDGTLRYRVEAVNREGDGRVTFDVRFAATAAELPTAAASVSRIDVVLLPDSTTVAEGTIDLDDTAVALFANESVWVSIEADLRVGAADGVGDSLAGRLWLRGLDVRVVADEDFF